MNKTQADLTTFGAVIPPRRFKCSPQCEGCGTIFTETQFEDLPLLGKNVIWNIEVRECPYCACEVLGWLKGGS